MIIKSKKAMSLIEVVVACTILLFVFAGTVTLIVNVVQLTVNSRHKTIAVAFAQRQMTACLKEYYKNTSITACPSSDSIKPAEISSGTVTMEKSGWSYTAPGGDMITSNEFVRFTSTVNWNIKGIPGSYSYVQLIKVP